MAAESPLLLNYMYSKKVIYFEHINCLSSQTDHEFISENIKRPDMMLKLQGPSSYKALNEPDSNTNGTKATSFALKSNIYSPKSLSESDKLTDSFPYLTTTASISATSYDVWLDSYNNNKLINDQDLLKSVSDNKSSKISSI